MSQNCLVSALRFRAKPISTFFSGDFQSLAACGKHLTLFGNHISDCFSLSDATVYTYFLQLLQKCAFTVCVPVIVSVCNEQH